MSTEPHYDLLNHSEGDDPSQIPLVSECSVCGAVVRDEQVHTAWHAAAARAIAAPLVAAELREASRLAWDATSDDIAAYLSNRADELDPP